MLKFKFILTFDEIKPDQVFDFSNVFKPCFDEKAP